MAYLIDTRVNTEGLFARVAAALRGLNLRHAQYRVYRRTFDELNRLSVRELDDLGLNRSMLRSIAWEAAYGK